MLEFYHAPFSRSAGIQWILEELEVDYTPRLVDIRAPGGAPESYRNIHPHKKVPAIVHDGTVITESAAIAIYLGDAFPKGDVTPAIGDPRRGPYLSWLMYLAGVYDPALTARIKGWQYDGRETSFGSFDDVLSHVQRTLSTRRYALGDNLTLVDLQLSGGLGWAMDNFDFIPEAKYVRDYIARVRDRPSYARFMAKQAV